MSTDTKFDVTKFVSDLSASSKKAGAESLWKLDLKKLSENQDKILQQPLQCRIIVKALLIKKPDAAFTYSQLADWAVENGLSTRQDPMRIVRYYSKQLREFVLTAA